MECTKCVAYLCCELVSVGGDAKVIVIDAPNLFLIVSMLSKNTIVSIVNDGIHKKNQTAVLKMSVQSICPFLTKSSDFGVRHCMLTSLFITVMNAERKVEKRRNDEVPL